MFNQNQQYNFMDAVNVIALLIGLENLFENRTQSAQNDVQAANDAQARYLLEKIGKKFDEQNLMLEKIIELLQKETP